VTTKPNENEKIESPKEAAAFFELALQNLCEPYQKHLDNPVVISALEFIKSLHVSLAGDPIKNSAELRAAVNVLAGIAQDVPNASVDLVEYY